MPIDETAAKVLPCEESRAFLQSLDIGGEIVHTPSHSEDSVTLILDDGDCFAGDLEPSEYIEAYGDNPKLKADWYRLMSFHPKRVFFSHRSERTIN